MGVNVLDTGAPFYDTYETSDGKFVSLGSLEPQFYAELIQRLGLEGEDLPNQMDRNGWDSLRVRFTELFKTKTRDEWDAILAGSDACYAPVLTMSEATNNEHIKARNTIIDRGGVPQPAPAPRFSRTAPEVQRDAPWPGQHTDEALADWGVDTAELTKLRETGAIA
jgi:alpha-methylacyl-CoA racemase